MAGHTGPPGPRRHRHPGSRVLVLAAATSLVLGLVGPGPVMADPADGATGSGNAAAHGSLARIVISPAQSELTAGGSRTYEVAGFDAVERPVGDLATGVRLSISPDGTCSADACTASRVGRHTVTASASRGATVLTATAVLDVLAPPAPPAPRGPGAGARLDPGGRPDTDSPGRDAPRSRHGTGPADDRRGTAGSDGQGTQATGHDPGRRGSTDDRTASPRAASPSAAHLEIEPPRAFARPGHEIAYRAIAFDAAGRRVGDVTSRTTFSIRFSGARGSAAPADGSCSGASCLAGRYGRHTVTGVAHVSGARLTGRAALQVVPRHRRSGALPHLAALQLRPESAFVESGGTVTFVAYGYDADQRLIGDVTDLALFEISPDGTCAGSTCTARAPGQHSVTARVLLTRRQVADTAQLLVTPQLAGVRVRPRGVAVEAGHAVRPSLHGLDPAGRPLVDLTAYATFGMGAAGSCGGGVCTPTLVGQQTVTGTVRLGDRLLADSTGVRVIPQVAGLELRPGSVATKAGRPRVFTAHGVDALGRAVTDLTDLTTFTTTSPAGCAGSSCRSASPGDFTVRGVVRLYDRTLSATAELHVTAGITGIVLEASARTVTAGETVTYSARGVDGEGLTVAELTDQTTFAITAPGRCAGSSCTATRAQGYTISGTVELDEGTFSATTDLTVVPGGLETLVLDPAAARVVAGEQTSFRVFGSDAFGNRLGDVTSMATFTMTAPGACSGATCAATAAQAYVVVARVELARALFGTAGVVVVPGPLEGLTLDPRQSRVSAGTAVTFRAFGTDAFGNRLGEVTRGAALSMTPPGVCERASCSATRSGTYTVNGTARIGARQVDAVATVEVVAGEPARVVLTPSRATVTAGDHVTFTATGTDVHGNPVGDLGPTFTIDAPASCTAQGSCTATAARTYTVVGTVDTGARAVRGAATLEVRPGPVARLLLDPPAAITTPAAGVTYRARGVDVHGNEVGDVTSETAFAITPDGSCRADTCSAPGPGQHTVTADLGAGRASAAARLLVIATPVLSVRVNPWSADVHPDQVATYSATAVDGDNNAVADVTAYASFAIAPEGSCEADTCSAHALGAHTVTGTVPTAKGSLAGQAQLHVVADPGPPDGNPGELVGLQLSPGIAEVDVGARITYVARGVDASGRRLQDLTSVTRFVMSPDGTCSGGTCVAESSGPHTVTGTLVFVRTTGVLTSRSSRVRTTPADVGASAAPADGLIAVERAVVPPTVTGSATLSVRTAARGCTLSSEDVRGMAAEPGAGTGGPEVLVTAVLATRVAGCPVVVAVAGTPVWRLAEVDRDGRISKGVRLPGPSGRDGRAVLTSVDGLPLAWAAFQLPVGPDYAWLLWLVGLTATALLAATAAGQLRDRAQRRWVAAHVSVEPRPAPPLTTAARDPGARPGPSLLIAPRSDPGTTTVTVMPREKEDR